MKESKQYYEPTPPLLDKKQVHHSHMNWVRSVMHNPNKTQQRTLDWLLDNTATIQKRYVIIDDTPVPAPTKRILWRKTAEKWVRLTKKA